MSCYGLLNEEEKQKLGHYSDCEIFCSNGEWLVNLAPFMVHRIYRKKVMSESECIKFLENSKTNPGSWPKEVQDLALKIQCHYFYTNRRVFEFLVDNKWILVISLLQPNGEWSNHQFRLVRGTWPVKMTESECIKFLENSVTKPATWPKEVQELAIKIQNYYEQKDIFAFTYTFTGCSMNTIRVQTFGMKWSDYPHRLKPGMWPVKTPECKPKLMTEFECIEYLENSTTKPAEWPESVQELALKIQENCGNRAVFEFTDSMERSWWGTSRVSNVKGDWSNHIYRLRKDAWPRCLDLKIRIEKDFKRVDVPNRGSFLISSVISHKDFDCFVDANGEPCVLDKACFVRMKNEENKVPISEFSIVL